MKNIITVLFLGAVWGFFEATLGGLLHVLNVPLTGQVMTAIGAGIMFFALSRGTTISGLIAISAVAASFKFFDVFLFGFPVTHIKILNPAQAILMQGLSFAVCARFINPLSSVLKSRVIFAFSFAFLSLALFNVLSYYLVGYKPAFEISNLLAFAKLNLPICTLLVICALYISELAGSVRLTLSPFMQGAASALLVAAAIITRHFVA